VGRDVCRRPCDLWDLPEAVALGVLIVVVEPVADGRLGVVSNVAPLASPHEPLSLAASTSPGPEIIGKY